MKYKGLEVSLSLSLSLSLPRLPAPKPPEDKRSSLSAPTLSASDLTSCCSQVTAGRPLSADLFHSRPWTLGLYSGSSCFCFASPQGEETLPSHDLR